MIVPFFGTVSWQAPGSRDEAEMHNDLDERRRYDQRNRQPRYDELVLRHPDAFIDYATDFRLPVGGDPPKGASWLNRTSRATRAPAILHRVISSG